MKPKKIPITFTQEIIDRLIAEHGERFDAFRDRSETLEKFEEWLVDQMRDARYRAGRPPTMHQLTEYKVFEKCYRYLQGFKK